MEVNMRKLLLVVAAFGSLAAADNSEGDASRVVHEIPWQSEWKGFLTRGEGMEEAQECTIEFLNDNEVKVTVGENSKSGHYRLAALAVPPRIDFTSEAPGPQIDSNEEQICVGIYRIGEDTLTLCCSVNSTSYPTEFSAQDPEGGTVLVTLKRKQP
jgi:uncharacterized protein (TIGR03067 family)